MKRKIWFAVVAFPFVWVASSFIAALFRKAGVDTSGAALVAAYTGIMWFLATVGLCAWTLVAGGSNAVARRREKRALSARADFEHNALLRGDLDLGVYGRFPPSNTEGS